MDSKKIIKYILVRLAFLAVPLFALFLLYYFTYEPYIIGEDGTHLYKGGPMGYAIFMGLIVLFWMIYIVIEGIIYFINRKKDSKFNVNIIFIAIAVFLVITFFL